MIVLQIFQFFVVFLAFLKVDFLPEPISNFSALYPDEI